MTLRKRVVQDEQSEIQQRWMLQALNELDIAQEELRTVEDELHARADELTVAYGALQIEARRYRDFFDAAPEPYLVTDRNGFITEANRRTCELLNVDAAFIVGKPLAVYIGEEDRGLMRNMLGLLTASAETCSFELRIQPRAARQLLWVSASVKRAPAQADAAPALCWMLHLRRMPRSSVAQGNTVEPEARASDSALQRLERELKRRDELLAFIAHELRNPLSSTAGWLEVLTNGGNGVASRQHVVEILSRNVKTLTRLVEELVDRTRIVEDTIVLRRQAIDLVSLLSRAAEQAQGIAHAKRVDFSYILEPGVSALYGDPLRIEQVLANVLGNAIKFTPAGGYVTLHARQEAETIEITVRDNGRGIAAEHLTQVFEPFIRVNPEGNSSGLGLGLHIARKLIELHGGTITAESAGLNSGSVFRMRLPGWAKKP